MSSPSDQPLKLKVNGNLVLTCLAPDFPSPSLLFKFYRRLSNGRPPESQGPRYLRTGASHSLTLLSCLSFRFILLSFVSTRFLVVVLGSVHPSMRAVL